MLCAGSHYHPTISTFVAQKNLARKNCIDLGYAQILECGCNIHHISQFFVRLIVTEKGLCRLAHGLEICRERRSGSVSAHMREFLEF